jgi:hypothetical protein
MACPAPTDSTDRDTRDPQNKITAARCFVRRNISGIVFTKSFERFGGAVRAKICPLKAQHSVATHENVSALPMRQHIDFFGCFLPAGKFHY